MWALFAQIDIACNQLTSPLGRRLRKLTRKNKLLWKARLVLRVGHSPFRTLSLLALCSWPLLTPLTGLAYSDLPPYPPQDVVECIDWDVPDHEKRAAELHTGGAGPHDPLALAVGGRRSRKTISIVFGHRSWDDHAELRREAARAIAKLRRASAICRTHRMVVSFSFLALSPRSFPSFHPCLLSLIPASRLVPSQGPDFLLSIMKPAGASFHAPQPLSSDVSSGKVDARRLSQLCEASRSWLEVSAAERNYLVEAACSLTTNFTELCGVFNDVSSDAWMSRSSRPASNSFSSLRPSRPFQLADSFERRSAHALKRKAL